MSALSVRPASGPAGRRLAVSGACCALLLAAVGCGDADTATDPSRVSSGEPTPTEPVPTQSGASEPGAQDESDRSGSTSGARGELTIADEVEPGSAMIVSASDVGGEISPRASALVDEQAVDGFLSTADQRLAADVRAAASGVRVPEGATLFGAVVAVGCDTPTAITWVSTFDGIEAEAALPKSTVQCLVPVTSVALFLVPD